MLTPRVLAVVWPFMHPALAAAALGAALLPILIHLINRRRFQRVPWAAMSFLLAANRRSARRVRLEQFLLLALRVIIVLACGLALARPYLARESLRLGTSSTHHVILLDNSLSMQAIRPDGKTRFDAARNLVQQLIGAFPPGDGVSLLTTAPSTALIDEPTLDRRFLREALAAIAPAQQPEQLDHAFEGVLTILEESQASPGNRRVYFISDFQSSVWLSDAHDQPAAAVLQLTQLADRLEHPESNLFLARIDPGPSQNIAVTDLQADSSLLSTQVPTTIRANVSNFGPKAVRNAAISFRRGDQTLRRDALPLLEPGAKVPVVFSMQFPSPGSILLEARVSSNEEDVLQSDDTRLLAVEARESIPVLIVDGRPGARLIDGQAGYLAVALAPRDESAAASQTSWSRARANLFEVKVISEPELGTELSGLYDVVAMCNVSQLGPGQWAQLEQFVTQGGGLFVALGGLVHADHYNRHAFREGQGLLPALLEGITEPITPPLPFQLEAGAESVLSDFIEHHSSGLFSSRTSRYVRVTQLNPQASVPLRYSSGDPALILLPKGLGKVALWTTSANMEWNNLPARGDYVAVMAKIIGSLAPRRGAHRNLLVGSTITERLTLQESSMPLLVRTGDHRTVEPSILPLGSDLSAQFGPLELAGPLTLSIGNSERYFAVNIDTRESALQSASTDAIMAAFQRPCQWMTEGTIPEIAPARFTEWSHPLLWALVALLIVEIWLAQRFLAPLPARHEAWEKQSLRPPKPVFVGVRPR